MDFRNGTVGNGEDLKYQHDLLQNILGVSLLGVLLLLLFTAVCLGLCKAIAARRVRKLNPSRETKPEDVKEKEISTVSSNTNMTSTSILRDKQFPSTHPSHFLSHNIKANNSKKPKRLSSAQTFFETVHPNPLSQRRRSPSLALPKQNFFPLNLSAIETLKRAQKKEKKSSPRPSEESSSLRRQSATSSKLEKKSLQKDESLASRSSSNTIHQLSLLGGEEVEERRPSKTTVSEEQLLGLDLPYDQEFQDRQKEMIKKILGPPKPVID